MQQDSSYWLWEKDLSYKLGMEPDEPLDSVRRLIVVRAKETGQTLKSLSLGMGRNETYLQQFVTRKKGATETLRARDRRALAPLIGVDEASLRADSPAPPRQNARMAGPVVLGATVPAYGQAAGGKDGRFVLNGNKIADILAPPSLAGVRDAYAVYVVGDSMEERYHPGEIVFVNPRLPVRRGDYVVAQIAGEEGAPPDGYIKRFMSLDARHLKLEQLNPRKLLQFPASRVVSVHRIVMGGDG